MKLPALDILLHNAAAFGIAMVAMILLAQLVMTAILRVSGRLLRSKLFEELGDEPREAFRRQVRRATAMFAALIGIVLLACGLIASWFSVRVGVLVRDRVMGMNSDQVWALGRAALTAIWIAVMALVAARLVRAGVDILSKGLEKSKWLEKRRKAVGEALLRLRVALRTAILCGTAVLIADTLALPDMARRGLILLTYVLVTFYATRFAVGVAHLVIDVIFDLSGKLTRLESPLKYLGNLTHLAGLTKRAVEYFVYVGAATWVADQLTPDTWPSRAGRVGIRMIAIFYASRVLVEVCILLVNELLLGDADNRPAAEQQQRKTLVPVAASLIRYLIYFVAVTMVLQEAGIDTTPLLAGAGALGVAVGLGAQAFMGDIVGGFFILFESLFLVGDLVEVAGVKGTVEEIGIRMTTVRDEAGVLHAIPNGEVRKVSSHSKGYVNAVVDVRLPYDEDQARALALLTEATEEMISAEKGDVGPAEVKVQELADAAVIARVILRAKPGQDEEVGDRLRVRLLAKLRGAGVEAPHARRVLLLEKGGRWPATTPMA